MTADLFEYLVYGWIALAVILFPLQLLVRAPYGRHQRAGWGPVIDNRLGWIIMEGVSPLVFAFFFFTGPAEKTLPLWIMCALWMAHYIHRAFIFPMRMRTSGKVIPVMIVAFALMFNAVNGWTNGWYLGSGNYTYPLTWLIEANFIIGLTIFLAGAWINVTSDTLLLGLRQRDDTSYKIPRGGMFRFVSCPNHFGEIIQWIGFAILCWSLPALAFAIWTVSNLLPRALAHHQWYKEFFPDYPGERKAVIPFLL